MKNQITTRNITALKVRVNNLSKRVRGLELSVRYLSGINTLICKDIGKMKKEKSNVTR